MKKIIYFTTGVLTLFFQLSHAQQVEWAYSEGGSSNYAEAATSLAVDGSGNVYTTGFFSNNFGSTDFDPGPGYYNLSLLSD